MTIKLDSLSRWAALPQGDVLTLAGTVAERRIRLQVNSPGAARLFVVNADGEEVFLAAPVGRETVEFSAGGDVRITTADDDVFVYTAELEPTSAVIPDPVVFTKIAQRRARNPEMEQMMFLMNQNMDRRLAAQAAEHAEMMAAFKEGLANASGVHVGETAEHQEPDEETPASADSAVPAGVEGSAPDGAGQGRGASGDGVSSGAEAK